MKKKELRLSDIPRHQVHRVPDGYFDRLPTRIMERTAGQELTVPDSWLARLWQSVRFAVAPLLLLLLFACVYMLGMQRAPQPEALTVASLTDEEIVNYLSTYAQVETADLEEHLAADQDLSSDFLNVNARTAEVELEYYSLDDLDY